MEFTQNLASQFASQLSVQGIQLFVHLGYSEQERRQKQEVLVDLLLFFKTDPKASLSDRLEDTICYHTLVTRLRSFVNDQHYRMVEKLGFAIFQFFREVLPSEVEFKVDVTKVRPPVEGLLGGVQFSKWSF